MILDPDNGFGTKYGHTPRWMLAVIILLALPVFQMPALLSACPPDMSSVRSLIWGYPFYVLLTSWLSYLCYPTRPVVSWILLIIMVMSHMAIYLIVHQ